jgi:hypothetical protein
VRHAISLVFALCISIIGGTAFVYMIHAHSGGWRWVYPRYRLGGSSPAECAWASSLYSR